MKVINYSKTPNPTTQVSAFDKQVDAKLNATVNGARTAAAAEAVQFLGAEPSDAARSLRKAAAEATDATG